MSGSRRGFAGLLERSWSGEAGTMPWTRIFEPAALVYAAASARARARARARRRSVPGLHVVAVGGLTVAGSGKSSLARWIALDAIATGHRPAVLLRGHGGRHRGAEPWVLPDFEGYPLARAADLAGDEAAAHRAALPREAVVAAHPDRCRAARSARSGYGADLAVLDDGWEQSALRWDELWVALDPDRPAGNGALLPAGPLRRPASTLREADVIAFVLEAGAEGPSPDVLAWTRARAPGARVLRFRRTLESVSELGSRSAGGSSGDREPAAILSGVGSPRRLERFVRESGFRIVFHADFPDHARWRAAAVERASHDAALAGARLLLVTEKDEPRWPRGAAARLPVRVLRTSLVPVGPVERGWARAGASLAPRGSIG